VSSIPGNREVKELQKTAILGTAHILREVLTLKYSRANAGTRDIGTINSNDRIAATMYSLGAGLSQEYMYKQNAVPLQAWSGPEGSRKLRFPDF
jgi:hypothetical protein